MSKKDTSKVLTGNRLTDGEAIWFGTGGHWIETLDGAQVADTPDAVAGLEAVAARDVAANLVIDVDLIDVERDAGSIRPIRLRERIRAAGPTFRTDLGKQARSRSPARAA